MLLLFTFSALAQPPSQLVDLKTIDPTILHDIRYYTKHNFVGRRIDGYHAPKCWLTRPAALALKKAQTALRKENLSLKVYDCYRPQRAVNHFVRWAKAPKDTAHKAEFYPNVPKDRLFKDGYIASRSGHSRGSTVDVTLVRLPPRAQPLYHPTKTPCFSPNRYPDNSLDMGTAFDCFSPLSHTLNESVGPARLKNRMILRRALRSVGFENYPKEWWHFTLKGEPLPKTYLDHPIR